MLIKSLIGVVLLSSSTQVLTVVIPPNTPFGIEFFHDPSYGPIYHWECDGVIVKNFTTSEVNAGKSATPDANGLYKFSLVVPGLSFGKHSCLVSVDNDFGKTKTDPIEVPVGVAPKTPIGLRLVIEVKIGGQ
jgi:hypothetical protein